MLQTQHETQEANDEEREADKTMIEEEVSDERVGDAEVGQLQSNKLAELEVVIAEKDIPVDILGHGDLGLLLLVALDAVYLREDDEGQQLHHHH